MALNEEKILHHSPVLVVIYIAIRTSGDTSKYTYSEIIIHMNTIANFLDMFVTPTYILPILICKLYTSRISDDLFYLAFQDTLENLVCELYIYPTYYLLNTLTQIRAWL